MHESRVLSERSARRLTQSAATREKDSHPSGQRTNAWNVALPPLPTRSLLSVFAATGLVRLLSNGVCFCLTIRTCRDPSGMVAGWAAIHGACRFVR